MRGTGSSTVLTWPAAAMSRWNLTTAWVARSLEREWNEKLVDLDQLEREYTAWSTHAIPALLRPEERQRILAWSRGRAGLSGTPAPATTTHTERKQLLRCLVRDVTLTRR